MAITQANTGRSRKNFDSIGALVQLVFAGGLSVFTGALRTF
jgi:hypothetical protein